MYKNKTRGFFLNLTRREVGRIIKEASGIEETFSSIFGCMKKLNQSLLKLQKEIEELIKINPS